MVSVIIPMYNSDKYIKRCLKSVQNQTYRDLEIICVDDGSTDDTIDICRKIQERDQRIYIRQIEHRGVSRARNEGMKQAKGDYISFIDADDWVEPDFYKCMMTKANEVNADVIICSYSEDYDDIPQIVHNKDEVLPLFGTDDFLRYVFVRDRYRGVAGYVVNKIYRTDYLRHNELYFDEKLQMGEGMEFVTRVALGVRLAAYIDIPLYHYCQNQDSVMHKKDVAERKRILNGYQQIIEILERKNKKEIVRWVKRFYVYQASKLLVLARENAQQEEMQKMKEEIKRYYEDYVVTNSEYPERIFQINRLLQED